MKFNIDIYLYTISIERSQGSLQLRSQDQALFTAMEAIKPYILNIIRQ